MKRAVGIIGTVLLLLLSFALYNGVYLVRAQEKELRALDASIVKEAEAIRVLKAEWSYLNQPERLQSLARRHLTLAPTAPNQIVIMANLPEKPETEEQVVPAIDPNQLPFRPSDKPAAKAVTKKPGDKASSGVVAP